MPIAILEAMATKCAIISSPVGHIPHIIKNRNGILVEPHSKEDLYNAICNLYNNPDLVNSMKKQNYQDIQDYSWENNIDKIAEAYYEMLGGNYDKD
jgi:glycosyltransferase involved in cell wall biosynthesis